jgi:hypothetical protein
MTDKPYDEWLAKRRNVSPPAPLADQIMSRVATLERQRQNIWWLLVIQSIEHSRPLRWAVCGTALAIGGLPFVFLAYAFQFLTF